MEIKKDSVATTTKRAKEAMAAIFDKDVIALRAERDETHARLSQIEKRLARLEARRKSQIEKTFRALLPDTPTGPVKRRTKRGGIAEGLLKVLAGGERTKKDLAKQFGASTGPILNNLRKDGRVQSAGRGVWKLTGK